MLRSASVALAMFLWTVLPAAAQDWRDIGDIAILPKGDIFVQRLRLEGPVEQLRFQARNGDAACLNVQAFFRDDARRVIFHGPVLQNAPVTLDFEGGDSSIRLLYFRCSGAAAPAGEVTLSVSANIGRFAAEWSSRSPVSRAARALHNFGSVWRHDWRYVGGRRFASRYGESEIPAPGAPISALALMPVGHDARCRSAEMALADGRTVSLPLSRDIFLDHDRYNRVELPGGARAAETLRLDCRATNGGTVMIQLFAAS